MLMKQRWFVVSLIMLIASLVAVTQLRAFAQNPEAPEVAQSAKVATSSAVDQTLSVGEILEISGWPMYVLIGVSFLAAAFVIYFFCVLRLSQISPLSLRQDLLEKTDVDSLDEVRAFCAGRPCPLSSVAIAGLDYLKTMPNADATLLKDVIQSEGTRQGEAIRGQTRYLMDIAAVAPMIGLLGTVLGMVRAFRGVALDEAMARPVVLADGVQQALYTTAAGLIIAIPAMMFYSFFRERANTLISHLEAASTEVLTNLQRKRN